MTDALGHVDLGNHHFPSPARTALAERLVALSGHRCVARSSARAAARRSTSRSWSPAVRRGRRRIVSIVKATTATAASPSAPATPAYSEPFLSDRPDEFTQVRSTTGRDGAGARWRRCGGRADGDDPCDLRLPLPAPGYLDAVFALCQRSTARSTSPTSVQTGLGRTGPLWGIEKTNVVPDLLVTRRGSAEDSSRSAPSSMSERACSAWLDEDGFAHMSTGGGASSARSSRWERSRSRRGRRCGRTSRPRAQRFNAGLGELMARMTAGSPGSVRTGS